MSTPSSAASEQRRDLAAGAVVRVEMDRDADLLLERSHQQLGRVRLAQPGHVLDGQQVRAQLLQFLGQIDVVLQAVLGPCRIEYVAGVANGRLRIAFPGGGRLRWPASGWAAS